MKNDEMTIVNFNSALQPSSTKPSWFELLTSLKTPDHMDVYDIKYSDDLQEIILTDCSGSKLSIVNTRNRKWRFISLPGQPKFLTLVPIERAATTLQTKAKNSIALLHLRHGRILQERVYDKTDILCGVTYSDGQIFVSSKLQGIIILDNKLTKLDTIAVPCGETILQAGFMKQLYCAGIKGTILYRLDIISKTFMEFDLANNKLASMKPLSMGSFKEEEMLKHSTESAQNQNITLDMDGNIYIVRDCGIHQIRPDLLGSEILHMEGLNLTKPNKCAIVYRTKKNQLLVHNENKIFFFQRIQSGSQRRHTVY